jgi:hypothetical protein
MKILYLDQNKWVDLARARKNPASHPENHALLERLVSEVDAGRLCIPLNDTLIYETYKRGDPQQRRDVALVQSRISLGRVFPDRRRRLEREVREFARAETGLPSEPSPRYWYISNIFLDAFPDSGASDSVLENARHAIAEQPCSALFDFLTSANDHVRLKAVQNWSSGADALRRKLESNRAKILKEPMAMQRRMYSALLVSNDLERSLKIAQEGGVSWKSLQDIGEHSARRLIEAVPVLHVERELVLRRNAENRPLCENDFRDLMAVLGAVPYSDMIVAEKNFVSLAIQSGLGKKYGTVLATNIADVNDWLGSLAAETVVNLV